MIHKYIEKTVGFDFEIEKMITKNVSPRSNKNENNKRTCNK